MAKRIKLEVEPFDDVKIIGINTSMVDYQLAWNLNKTLKLNFVKCQSLELPDKGYFSFYYYDKGENYNTFNLVSLMSNEGKEWVSFKPKTDFFFLVRKVISDAAFSLMLEKINNIPKIYHAYIVDIDNNAKIDIMLEDIELHEFDIYRDKSKK